jgi:hypothetical protein
MVEKLQEKISFYKVPIVSIVKRILFIITITLIGQFLFSFLKH